MEINYGDAAVPSLRATQIYIDVNMSIFINILFVVYKASYSIHLTPGSCIYTVECSMLCKSTSVLSVDREDCMTFTA